jgi:tetratricopeptide (TPR) repeat protein/uncharacterized caspase-like protein
MRHLLFFLVIYCCLPARALLQANSGLNPEGNTYAVIVGISSYESDGIPKLNFAHRDAEEFEKFLLSKAGGAVPADNIRLMLNENATYTSIYNALYWLLEVAGKDDIVYFYFSGHGDMENNTIDNLGFLLAVNTPRNNYLHNAVRLEDVNRIANTLSVTRGSRVILITDACHSGDLAGKNIRGTQLTGDQLRTASGKEIRITSCGPDELSNEDEKWGGGRGVFSYYLVKGLEGLADFSNDKVITLEEVKNYLTRSFASDKILNQKENKQTPVVSGKLPTALAKVDKQRLDSMRLSVSPAPIVENQSDKIKPLGTSPQGYFFSLVDKWNIEKQVDFYYLQQLPKEEIPFEFIRQVIKDGFQTGKIDSTQVNRLINSLTTNPDAFKRFNDKLIELLSDRGQRMINHYLEGDEAELEKRRYYNSSTSDYDVFAKIFDVALKLSPPASGSGFFRYSSTATGADAYLPECLEIKYHYFSGVAARLKMPLSTNTDSLLNIAFREQQKALKLEDNAAYIHNELGILYKYKKDYLNAEKHYLRATSLSPAWAIPWANLTGLYGLMNKKEEGLQASAKALKLQPGFQGTYVNTGLLHEKNNNYLLAEEYFRKSIQINSRHYLPFDRLGFVYMNTTRYAEADSFFLEGDKRKRGFNMVPDSDGDGVVDQFDMVASPQIPCKFDTTTVKANDVIGNFFIALQYIWGKQPVKAEWKLKQLIRMNPTHPLAFHFLGKLMYEQKRWQETEISFQYALRNYLSIAQFDLYCDSLKKIFTRYSQAEGPETDLGQNHCVFIYFKNSWFKRTDTRYFLGDAYQRWNHFDEAENQFRAIIQEEPEEMGAYKKLWAILESRGRYYAAEESVKFFPDKQTSQNELFAFYHRVISQKPDVGEWYLKAGSLMHEMATSHPEKYTDDQMYIVPDSKIEKYRDAVIYQFQAYEEKWIPAIKESYQLFGDVLFPRTEGIYFLRMADSLLADAGMAAEANNKLGDLYTGQGLPQKAIACYKKVTDLQPEDANALMKLAAVNDVTFNLADAMAQLDSLNKRGEINYQNQLQLARYCIHAGRMTDATALLDKSAKADQLKTKELSDLYGRLQLLSGKPLKALPFYNEYNGLYPNDASIVYTIARIYAMNNNSAEALKWLSISVNKGFNYYWVLKYDPSWDKLRTTARWKQLTAGIKSKG